MYRIIPIRSVKIHEKTTPKLKKLLKQIKKDGYVIPVVVDKKHKILLDGHHRYTALKKLGYKKIPAYLVDYRNVKVATRRKDIEITREIVIKRALSGKPFPPKTTRHIYSKKWKNVKVPLEKLA